MVDAAPRPDGFHTVTPRLVHEDVAGLAEFLRTVFDAEGEVPEGRPAQLKIGDSIVMVSDGGGVRSRATGFLYVYVADVDVVFQRAVEERCVVLEQPQDTDYGERRAMFEDSWGNLWQIASVS